MDVVSAFLAGEESAKAVDLSEGVLDNPTSGWFRRHAGLCGVRSRDDGRHGDRVNDHRPVGVEFAKSASPPARFAADRRDPIERFLERHVVVGVGICQDEGERDDVPVGD